MNTTIDAANPTMVMVAYILPYQHPSYHLHLAPLAALEKGNH
jgi:hypothetical protein